MMKLEVETHSGKHFELDVLEYNAVEMNTQLNDNNVYTVVIGDTIFSRIDIKLITPIKEPEQLPVTEPPTTEEPPTEETGGSGDGEVTENQPEPTQLPA